MKKYHHFILGLIVLTGMIITSCKKTFLDIGPEATINGSRFFSTEAEILQAVNGAYSTLRILGVNSYWVFGEMRSDNTANFQTNTGGEQRELIDQFLTIATNDNVRGFWQQSYIGISRCNDVLDHIETVIMTDDNKKRYKAEAKFLRAFYYFQLVRQFGGVPLRITSIQSAANSLSAGRATKDIIYGQIISDLTAAIADLPSSYTGKDLGRATQGAARIMLGEVLMTQKKFAEALAQLQPLKALGYSLLPVYKSIFDPKNKNNAESIFEIQYLGSQPALASNFMYTFAPANSGSNVTGDPGTSLSLTSGWNTPTADLISAYEPNDVRKAVSLNTGYLNNGAFVNAPHVIKYNHGFVNRGNTDDNFPVYRYADALLLVAECLNETAGINAESFDNIDKVRIRAGLLPLARGAINTQSLLRLAIEKERRVELAFENHRWYDLVRTGRAIEVMNAHGIQEKALKPTVIRPAGFNVTPNNLLLPIPQQDISVDNLEQNP